jgi:Outer membrane protein beta-barrel domain
MRRLAFVLLLLAVPTSVFAQSWRRSDRYDRYRDSAFELTPFLGYRYGGTITADTTNLFGGDVNVDSNMNYGANFGIPIGDQGYKLAFFVDRQDTRLSTGDGGDLFGSGRSVADFHITYFQGGVEIPFNVSRRSGVTPYVGVSAGVANLEPDVRNASSATRFAASAAIGVKIPINPQIGIRIEERGFFTNTSGNNDFGGCDAFGCSGGSNLYQGETNVGVTWRF